MLLSRCSRSGKTNILVDLLLDDKLIEIYYKWKVEKIYIPYNNIVLIGKYLEKLK